MTQEFELPKEGIKIYTPDTGWRSAGEESPSTAPLDEDRVAAAPYRDDEVSPADIEEEEPWAERNAEADFSSEPQRVDARVQESPVSPRTSPAQPLGSSSGALSSSHAQAAALAEVGDSLHSLFVALQQPTVPADVVEAGPTWRDVADQSRLLEDRLVQRAALLEQLAALERDIRLSREELLSALRGLAQQEQRNLESATMRANISTLAANVIAKKFSI